MTTVTVRIGAVATSEQKRCFVFLSHRLLSRAPVRTLTRALTGLTGCAPVRTPTRALTGLTGCACLSAVALWGTRGICSLNVLHLLLRDLNTS